MGHTLSKEMSKFDASNELTTHEFTIDDYTQDTTLGVSKDAFIILSNRPETAVD